MKKIIWIIYLALLGLVSPINSFADNFSARDIFKYCRTAVNAMDKKTAPNKQTVNDDLGDIGWCTGYILGINDMQFFMAATFSHWPDDYKKIEKNLLYCLPDGVKTTDLERIVVKYAEDHPEFLYLNADLFIIKAFKQFYPCDR